MATITPHPHLDVNQVAARLSMCREAVLRLIRGGDLRAIDIRRPGGRRPCYRVPLAALEQFEAERLAEVVA